MPIAIRRKTLLHVLVAMLALPLYVLGPTGVGLNDDLARYGASGLGSVCGDSSRVWANYQREPIFAGVLTGFSRVWAGVTGFDADRCRAPGLNVYWLPISLAVTLILLQLLIVRHLGASALAFHAVFCLDTVLMMLPFNLLRQFLAVVLALALLALLVRERISPVVFASGLVASALIHWSGWLLVGVSGVAMFLNSAPTEWLGTVRVSRRTALGGLVLGAAALAAAYAVVVFALPRFQLAVSGSRGLGLSLESSVRGLVSPITMSILTFAAAIAVALKAGFLRMFVIVAAATYFLVAISGSVAAMERLRAFVLPMTYFVFLSLLRARIIAPRWRFINVLFLVFILCNFAWHAAVLKPFAGRPSFAQLVD